MIFVFKLARNIKINQLAGNLPVQSADKANLFYEISLDKKEKKILTKSLKENKNFLHAVKKDFDEEIIKSVEKCLQYKSCGVLIE